MSEMRLFIALDFDPVEKGYEASATTRGDRLNSMHPKITAPRFAKPR